MDQKIILAAQQFSSEHFSDLHLDQQQFKELIGATMRSFPELTDKVTFLSEVIRLGNVYIQNSVSVLQQIEGFDGIHEDASRLN